MRRNLTLWGALGLSLAITAPTLAMGLNGALPAKLAGSAVPLVFLIGFVGVAAVMYGFVRLTRYFNHAGSVYALAGVTMGPRAGFFGGFALLGVYTALAISTLGSTAQFTKVFLADAGVHLDIPWPVIALATLAFATYLATMDTRNATRVLLTIESIGIVLMLVIVVVVFAKLAGGDAPRGQTFSSDVLVPSGVSFGAIMAATVYAFLSFAGIEGAAALGEETRDPRRNIPRSIIGAVLLTGVLYFVVMLAQTLGFGTDAAGVKAFGESGAPLADVAKSYAGSTVATAFSGAATVSSFAAALGCVTAASRILFALGRDGFGFAAWGREPRRGGTPIPALLTVAAVSVVATLAHAIAGTSPFDMYFYWATLGVIGLLVVYAVTSLGALRYLFTRGLAPRWEAVIPVVAVAYLAYVFYKQVWPVPDPPYNLFPYIVAAWLLAGVAMIVFRPELTRRIGEGFERAEGLLDDEPKAPSNT
ncbi:APC family permease [Actinomadura formosensis]|uniref:APC family permease n=1 Tax=Actinomadura formosensis TaxID=60706 RepID=UPI003D8AACC4